MAALNHENYEGSYFKYTGDETHTAKWRQTSYYKKANDNFRFMRIS